MKYTLMALMLVSCDGRLIVESPELGRTILEDRAGHKTIVCQAGLSGIAPGTQIELVFLDANLHPMLWWTTTMDGTPEDIPDGISAVLLSPDPIVPFSRFDPRPMLTYRYRGIVLDPVRHLARSADFSFRARSRAVADQRVFETFASPLALPLPGVLAGSMARATRSAGGTMLALASAGYPYFLSVCWNGCSTPQHLSNATIRNVGAWWITSIWIPDPVGLGTADWVLASTSGITSGSLSLTP